MSNEKLKNLNSRIKECRKSLGLTQQQFADALSMTRSNYAHLESEGNPSPETLLRLSGVLKISIDDLLGNEKPQTNAEIQTIASTMTATALRSHSVYEGELSDEEIDKLLSPPDAFLDLDPVEREIIVNYRIMSEADRKKIRTLIMKLREKK